MKFYRIINRLSRNNFFAFFAPGCMILAYLVDVSLNFSRIFSVKLNFIDIVIQYLKQICCLNNALS